jgi:hypothetical protein
MLETKPSLSANFWWFIHADSLNFLSFFPNIISSITDVSIGIDCCQELCRGFLEVFKNKKRVSYSLF